MAEPVVKIVGTFDVGLPTASTDVRGLEVTSSGVRHRVIISRDEIAAGDQRWHISISSTNLPRWRDMAAIAHELRPGVPFCHPLPPRSWWINLHETTMHLWEVKDEALIEQWRRERMGMVPT